jgi:hypothetical protein
MHRMRKRVTWCPADSCSRIYEGVWTYKIKMIVHNLLENASHEEARNVVPGRFLLPHIRGGLDLSFPSTTLKNDTKLEVCILALIAMFA